MTVLFAYKLGGLCLFFMGFTALILRSHPLKKIMAVNVMAAGVFLLFIAMACHGRVGVAIDPVPQAMVLTGIVVSVSVTALALVLACRIQETSGGAGSSEGEHPPQGDS
ncbi:MAG: cation:proton antiporter subunit C [Desulfobulbaceae bacterium]|uniref:Cation:proton antiporter subunit C n=1 Tax=Candidatus Desulfatifera sulfidica TaxID=2841691 RepID=A0A8J6N5L9_9BACT|nr:cation:proton antiporter subunit C [Candidatus Desulfatifera sulfidica]